MSCRVCIDLTEEDGGDVQENKADQDYKQFTTDNSQDHHHLQAAPQYHKVEHVVCTVLAHVATFPKRHTVYGRVHGGNNVFLASGIAAMMESDTLKETVLSDMVEPMFLTLMEGGQRHPTDFAIILSNALILLDRRDLIVTHCLPFIDIADLDRETLPTMEEDNYQSYDFAELLTGFVMTYFESWAVENISELATVQ